MPNSSFRVSVLNALLAEAGIPVTSIQVIDINATPVNAVIQYPPEATQQQINLGNDILANFDWRRRRALNRSTVVTALNQLTSNQQNAILRHMACDYLRNNPSLAAQIDAGLGTSLPVDEVDPT